MGQKAGFSPPGGGGGVHPGVSPRGSCPLRLAPWTLVTTPAFFFHSCSPTPLALWVSPGMSRPRSHPNSGQTAQCLEGFLCHPVTHISVTSLLQDDGADNVLTVHLPSLCFAVAYSKVFVKENLRLVFLSHLSTLKCVFSC